ncbi:hypothetical protein Taro_007224, partial [Colocasia esculenta]|nr:hypothetical protein [Colocasia esculenta]
MGRPGEQSTTMEYARVISIAELLQLGRPLTGAASLSHHPTPPPRGSSAAPSSPPLQQAAGGTPLAPGGEPSDPSAFHPLGFPAVLVGALGLSSGDGSHASGCGNHCFFFSDGSARVCCDILELDITVIGKDIRVLAWNFLPLQRGDGFLEIIRCSRANPELGSVGDPSPSAPSCFPQLEDRSRARSCAWGVLVSVGPVFSVPLSIQEGTPRTNATGGVHSVGFLTEISACKCASCAAARSLEDLHRCVQGRNCHSFDQQVFIYFRGPSSSWRPVLSKLVGKVVIASSLKKKCVSSGRRESLIFASTERTVVYTDMKPIDRGLAKRRAHLGKGQLGTYCGVVTGVFKRGMVVELDKKDVWLLITDPLLDLPHSLRVGAVITVKNVHFLRPNFSWLRILLLGSCVRTTIEFAGIFSDKEILGSRKVSPSSGRLQLVDSTGYIDVVTPDLSPSFDQHVVYE